MKTIAITLTALTLLFGVSSRTQAAISIPGLGNKSGGGGAPANGESFLQQLTPGAVKFTKAYSKYYASLGLMEEAKKMEVEAEAIEKGGSVSKETKKTLDGAQKKILEAKEKASQPTAEAEALWKEGNALYAAGLAEWAIVATAVSLAAKDDPISLVTNPAMTTASLLCLKGMKDMSGFLKIMKARSAEKEEQKKGAR